MGKEDFDMGAIDIAWCPGCGDFAILNALKEALGELGKKPENTVIISGIGQAAKTPHYLKCNFFNGLHGRTLSPAMAVKASNPELDVIITTGDGDMYGEGGNHFLHPIRRNTNITVLICNNMVYGLTKGQASPTSEKGFKTPIQYKGVILEPFNPMSVAIALDASFVARANCGDLQQTKEIIKKAIQHKGFALVDIFQPCVVYNKVNTYPWFKQHTYNLDERYDPSDKKEAFMKALEMDKMPLGIIYLSREQKTFEENIGVYDRSNDPLFKRKHDIKKIMKMIDNKRLHAAQSEMGSLIG